jgi:integrase
MSNRNKGARLYLRTEAGRPPTWIIRDGDKRISTGLAPLEREEAERRLAEFIAEKHEPSRERDRRPDAVALADVLNLYIDAKGASVAYPAELARRVEALARFWGTKALSDVSGASCRAYAAQRGSEQAARRELEDLRAAINHHRREGFHNVIVNVVLPPKAPARQRWLTRNEAARLIRAAWRYREVQKGCATGRRSRQHIARFVLVSLYTGTRSGAVCSASFVPAIGRGHVDLENGVFHRLPQGKRETNKRQPTIRLPTRLLAHLRRWHEKGISKGAVVEFDGKPVASVKKAFARVAKDAGLADVTPHTLRHTAVTWAMQGGADLWETAGHFGMSVEILENTYGHHNPDHGAGVNNALMKGGRK